MTAAPRILFIGLDAGDKDLILQWAAEGQLPTFKKLFGTAAWGITRNPPGLYVGAVWPSFYTGLSPARHGRYCYRQLVPGTYFDRRIHSNDVKGQPFWNVLDRAGHKVCVIDVPKVGLSPRFQGLQLADWGTHDPDRAGFRAWPPRLVAEIEAEFGREPVGICNRVPKTPAGLETFRQNLVRRIWIKEAIVRHFLDQGPWDLFMVGFAELHCVGHQCWYLHDSNHDRHDAALARVLGDPIRDVYTALDAALGRLLAEVDETATVVVLASHGMGPHYDGTHLMPMVLDRINETLPHGRSRDWAGWATRPPARWGDPALSEPPPRALCKSFVVPNNEAYLGIRINLVGREPDGRIEPGGELEDYCRALTQELLALRNRETGRPVFQQVLRTANVYRGSRLNYLPDLMAEWSREAPIRSIEPPTVKRVTGVYDGVRTGDHREAGLFFARGPGIKAGSFGTPVSVMDFAATIAALLGIELPDVDGRPIGALLGPTGRAAAATAASL